MPKIYKSILVLGDGTEIAAGDANDSAVFSLTYTATVSSTTDLCPGAACANKIEFEIWVQPGESLTITSGTQILYYRQNLSTNARTLVGTFWAVKPTRASRNTYKVYAYDAVSKLDGIQSTWLRSIQDNFPMTLWSFAQLVAQRCSLTISNTVLPRNGYYQVQAFYADNLTGRQLLSWVAEASGTFLRATPDGKLEFSWYTPDSHDTGIMAGDQGVRAIVRLSGDVLRTSQDEIYRIGISGRFYYQSSLTYEDYQTEKIDKVQIKQSDDDVGVIYPPDETGTNALVISGNLLLTTSTAETLQPVAQSLYGLMADVTYTPCEIEIQDDGQTHAGDIVEVTDSRGNTFTAYITEAVSSGGRLKLTCTGNASRDGTAAVNEQSYTNLQGRVLEISASVDGLKITNRDLQGSLASLELTVDGIETNVKKQIDDLTDYVDTETGQIKDEAVNEAVQQAVQQVDQNLAFYPTTVQMNSAIQQSASKINLSVNQKLEGYVTDADLNQYPTTVEMNSAISQSATQIELTVDRKLSGYATTEDFSQFQLEYDQFKLQVVRDGEVRSAFAADTDSVTITSGVITFSSNTLAVNSDNFTLDKTGNVTATGVFKTNNGISGNGRNEAVLSSGSLTLYRTDNSGNENRVVRIYGSGENTSLGNLSIHGPGTSGGMITQFTVTTGFAGSRLSMRDAGNTQVVVFNAGQGGNSLIAGNLDVQGSTGLGVSRTVSCQNLSAWGSKSRIVQTGFGNLKMAAFETPEPSFADTGSAQCNGDGLCVLALDPRFAETTDRYKALKWLVTPTGAGSVWVEKGEGFAIVHGVPGLSFDWMCIGTQAGYADVYAQQATEAPPAAHNPAYDQLDYITDITETNRQRAEALIPSYDYGTLLSDLMEE